MRNIGTLPTEDDARRFGDALYVRGVENDVEDEDDGTFSIWVHDDSQLDTARTLLTEFRANPQAEAFARSSEAERARAKAEKEDQRRASNVITHERMQYERTYQATTWLPFLLIIASIAVALQADTLFGKDPDETGRKPFVFLSGSMPEFGHGWTKYLHIQYPHHPKSTIEDYLRGRFQVEPTSLQNLTNLGEGQVWRLVTPIFIHFGFLHLIFNMMWVRDLGTFMQNRYGTLHLALLIIVTAALSNFSQYLVSGAAFGGMSGVNYALFGFLWFRGKYDRYSVWTMSPVIVQTMMMWFFVCLSGLMGNVANTAHFVGLAAGAAWGYLSARLSSRRRPSGS